jgi:hypothetical protein
LIEEWLLGEQDIGPELQSSNGATLEPIVCYFVGKHTTQLIQIWFVLPKNILKLPGSGGKIVNDKILKFDFL